MPEARVAIIYDDTVRPETAGGYCLRALESLARAEHFLPAQTGQIPRERFDLYLVIDDGMRLHLPADLRPAAWWAIDTHLDFEWYRGPGTWFDHVFVAQRPDVQRLSSLGVRASWLPLACARRAMEDAVAADPRDPSVLAPLCQLLFEQGLLSEAEGALTRLVDLAPDDAAAYHNLGTVYLNAGRREAAAAAFRRSLELRPDSAMTRQMLETAVAAPRP